MELYILDSLLRRTAVVDQYESMIWTERYSAYGDFELVISSTNETRALFKTGTRLAMSDSYRVMTVELTEDNFDSDGRKMLSAKGRSLEAILDERTARNSFVDLDTMPKWILTGKPGDIARQIFNDICRTNVLFPEDEIPFLKPGSIFPPSTIEEPDLEITIELSLSSVYEALSELCDAYDLGYRLVRNFDTSELYFDIYSGSDRTTNQNVLPPVVFSPELDNLTNTTELSSIANYKNVAYVFHPIGTQIVTADNVSPEVGGFERRVMHVDASDVNLPERIYVITNDEKDAIDAALAVAPNDTNKNALNKLRDRVRLRPTDVTVLEFWTITSLISSAQRLSIQTAIATSLAYNNVENGYLFDLLLQRGKEELSKNRSLSAFDGELPTNSPYKYNFAYNLGDLVEMRNADGATNQMRVTEQIFVSDSEGERSYPTLTIDLFITPGSWLAWNYNQVWQDADGVWQDS